MIMEFFLWWLIVEFFSILSLPISMKLFERLDDCGYAASKFLGILFISYISWLIGFAIGTSLFSIIISAVLLFFASACVFKQERKAIIRKIKAKRKLLLKIEILFFSLFLVFCVLRAQAPEIGTLEKFMDYAFLNSIARGSAMPPMDPWLSGGSINYYYFGHFMAAVLTKLSGLGTNITYNLMLSMYYALFCLLIFSIVFSLTKKFRYGILAVFLVAVLGNSFGLIQLFTFAFPQSAGFLGESLNLEFPITCCWNSQGSFISNINGFSLWPSTRIVPDTINEFPVASFLFGDLHSHYMGFAPVALFILTILCFLSKKEHNSAIFAIFLAFILGITALFNAWFFAACSLLLLISLFLALDIKNAIKIFIFMAVLGILFIIPFFITTQVPEKMISFTQETTSIIHLIIIFSLPLFAICYFLATHPKKPGNYSLFLVLLASALFSLFTGMQIAFLLLPIIAVSLWLILKKFFTYDERIILALILAGSAILLSTDILYFETRMNNIFKLYLAAWIFFGIAAAFIFSNLKSKKFRAVFMVIFAINLFVPVFTAIEHARHCEEMTMDGISYIKMQEPENYYAIEWINENIKGYPTILESPGRAYTRDSMISANTGLPTVIGWVSHEFVWRNIWYTERENDANAIYSTANASLALELLKKYNVSYVYVGGIERERYSAEGLAKFNSMQSISLVYDNGARIYRVLGQD